MDISESILTTKLLPIVQDALKDVSTSHAEVASEMSTSIIQLFPENQIKSIIEGAIMHLFEPFGVVLETFSNFGLSFDPIMQQLHNFYELKGW